MIGSDRGRLRQIRKCFERCGFASVAHASPWTDLLMQRADDRLGVTYVDTSRTLLSSQFGVADWMRRMSQESMQVIHARTVFVLGFTLAAADRASVSEAGICAVEADRLAGELEVVRADPPCVSGASATQMMLARQMAGMCRRFARAFEHAGDLDRAVAWRQFQAELTPRTIEMHWTLADLQAKRGELTEAEAEARALLRLAPETLGGWLLLSEIKQRQGDEAAARVLVAGTVRRFPDSDVARQRAALLGC